MKWANWSGKITAEPQAVVSASTEQEVVDLVRDGGPIRVAGATHSHAPLVPTDGTIIDMLPMAGMISADPTRATATFRAGTRIADTGLALREAGLALKNQGDIDQQALAGAIATGTHGTGPTLQNFSASMLGARLVVADGSVIHVDAESDPDLFQAARLSLGALGVMTEVTLAVRPSYKLAENLWLEPLDDVMARIDELIAATRHFEFFWYPHEERAICKAIAETDADPIYPLGKEGERTSWNYEVLANSRTDKHTEMEYSVPAESGPECLAVIQELTTRHPDVTWPIEYRTVASDDVWLSPARGRETVTISVHEDVTRDETPYYREAEEIFRSFGGRPHWGKVNYVDADGYADMYGLQWEQWWNVRNEIDPSGRFLNARLRSVAP
ncbi:MAG: FAD/FMN-containing dehydrogenase [Candidatus Poriferisodalaceae bacterium]|jgi:FAD/FMN-containing dehydrogenase